METKRELKRIDAHSHVNIRAYHNDAQAVIMRALDDGTGVLAVGTEHQTSAFAVQLAERHEGIWAVIGLHPSHLFPNYHDTNESEKEVIETFNPEYYRELAKSSKKVVGIGECGLDYYRLPEQLDVTEVKRVQQEVLRQHLDLALELDLPVMFHCRDAHDDLARILEEYAAAKKTIRGDIHCFTGTLAEAQRYLVLGLYVSFTGVITYKPRAADRAKGETLQDVARQIPLDRMLIETDAPYLAPMPHRGERNEPALVSLVAAQIAVLKGISTEEVERTTMENTKRLFRL